MIFLNIFFPNLYKQTFLYITNIHYILHRTSKYTFKKLVSLHNTISSIIWSPNFHKYFIHYHDIKDNKIKAFILNKPKLSSQCFKINIICNCIDSRLTSSDSFIFFVWILKNSSLPVSSGISMSISRLKRPKRRSAWSIVLGRLVAAIKIIFDLLLILSIKVINWETTRRSI